MKRILASAVAIAAATAFVGTASAADLGRRTAPVVKAPVYVAPLFSWTGFYIGGNLGYGWSNGSGTMSAGGAAGPITGSGSGILGGVQAGYNWQSGAFVFGVETDFQGTGADGNFSGTLVPGAVAVVGTSRTPYFGTIRGRLGYASDRWLFYVTGGGAYVQNEISGTVGGVASSASALGWAWTAGGGVETALTNNWSVKGEYLYVATPDKVPVLAGGGLSGDTDSHILRVGVNYHF